MTPTPTPTPTPTGTQGSTPPSPSGSSAGLQPADAAVNAAAWANQPVDCTVYKCAALTFDDGPSPATTPRLLGILRSNQVPATFFELATMVQASPATAQDVARTPAFEIGNHSFTHPQLTKLSAAKLTHEVSEATAVTSSVTGRTLTLMRPPYGAHNATTDAAAAAAGEAVIIWSVDTLDWQHHNPVKTLAITKQEIHPGGIVLMHDIHSTTVDAAQSVIDYLRGQGYVLVNVSQLLGTTVPGRVYLHG